MAPQEIRRQSTAGEPAEIWREPISWLADPILKAHSPSKKCTITDNDMNKEINWIDSYTDMRVQIKKTHTNGENDWRDI